jgi:hypothetical protein
MPKKKGKIKSAGKEKRGVSPILGAVFMFSILFSVFALFVIWQASVEQMELQKEREMLQREAEQGGESFMFFGYNTSTNTMGLLNNGSVTSTVVYVKEIGALTSAFNNVSLTIAPGESDYHAISITDWDSLVVGTKLGNEFVYNKPTAIIQKYEAIGADYTFYGDATSKGSTIVNWEWDWEYCGEETCFSPDAQGRNPIAPHDAVEGERMIGLRVTDYTGIQDVIGVGTNIQPINILGEVTPIIALENVGNTGTTYGSWWIFRFRKGCDQVSIPLQNISDRTIHLTDMKVFWHEVEQADPCISDLCPARLASIRIYRQYKPDGVNWNGEWILIKSTEPMNWNPDFDPDPSTIAEESFPSGIALLGKYRFMDPEELWVECFWGFYETRDCDCLDCEGSPPSYKGFNISGELLSFVDPTNPNTVDELVFEPGEILVVTIRFCAGNRCGDDMTLKLYDPNDVYTVTVHVPLDLQVGPRDGTIENTSTITFRWRELFDYETWFQYGGCVHDDDYYYWLQISPDPGFASGTNINIVGGDIFDYTEMALAKYTIALDPLERYYWRVNGSKDQGTTWSGWSRVWTFCTISCPVDTSTFLTGPAGALEPSSPYIVVLPLGFLWISLKKRRVNQN